LATQLEARGIDLNHPLWSGKVLCDPNLISLLEAVHLDYLNAGADIITTSSYQLSFEGFDKIGIKKEDAIKYMKLSVEIAIKVRDTFYHNIKLQSTRLKPLIAASVGCFGAILCDGSEYRGNYDGMTKEKLKIFHSERLKVILSMTPDLLAFETVPSMLEVIAITELLAEEHRECKSILCVSCKDEQYVSDGNLISSCAKIINECDQIVAFGINCTPPQYITALLKEARKGTSKPLVVYPNSGEIYHRNSGTWTSGAYPVFKYSKEQPYELENTVKTWISCGASIIGGCCRTTPEDIHAIYKIINSESNSLS